MTTKQENFIDIPKAKKIPFQREVHGKTLVDNYRWMRDAARDDESLLKHIKEENAYFKAVTEKYQSLKDEFFEEMLARTKPQEKTCASEEAPADTRLHLEKHGEYEYYQRSPEAENHPILCRQRVEPSAHEEIILDFNALAQQHDHFGLDTSQILYSPDHKYVLYTVDYTGLEYYEVKIFDIEHKVHLSDAIEKCWDAVWMDDSEHIFYDTFKGKIDLLSDRVYLHKLGDKPESDTLMFKEEDASFTFYHPMKITSDEKYLELILWNFSDNEYWYLDLQDLKAGFKVFSQRSAGHSYTPYFYENEIYVLTNKDGAFNNKIMKTTTDQTDARHWQEFIPHQTGVGIEAPIVFSGDFMIYKEREQGKLNSVVFDLSNGKKSYIEFPDPFYYIYDIALSKNDSNIIEIGYSSYVTPYTKYEYDLKQNELKIISQKSIKGFDKSLYKAEKVWATSSDGIKVPISLCYRKDLMSKDGLNPLFLDGYGMAGDTDEEYFSAMRISLLDRGGIFAVAHIRGSGYLGERWFADGKLLNKTNSFMDYIACAEHLIKEKYTSSAKLAAFGRSGGGYLVSSVLAKRPDLFRFAFMQVPGVNFLDDLIDKDPFFTGCITDEIGNPEKQEEFAVMLKNCPFYNIKSGSYPFIHILAGLTDTRNSYWGPMKWVAKIREHNTSDNPVLLELRNEGHSGHETDKHYFEKIYAGYYATIFYEL